MKNRTKSKNPLISYFPGKRWCWWLLWLQCNACSWWHHECYLCLFNSCTAWQCGVGLHKCSGNHRIIRQRRNACGLGFQEARLVDSSRNHSFKWGTQIWCARTADSLNLGGQTLHHWNLRLMPNIPYFYLCLKNCCCWK